MLVHLGTTCIKIKKHYDVGIDWAAVLVQLIGRVVASDTRGPEFKVSHWKVLLDV